ncbi:MAG: hypothetical protein J0H98_06325 [Solirubrobacterales bacterium]|nr:hypothetical protein [Solirubrobacterales bacterium]
MRRVMLFVSSVLVLVFSVGALASAATVSYIAGDSLWLSTPDGSKKAKLSGPAGDGREWTEQTQSDNGKVLAVRREPGKIAPLNSFTLFGPTGKVLQQGSLTHESGWTQYAYPVSLDLTDEGVAVYGYSNSSYGYPVWNFDFGTYVRTVEKPFTLPPFKVSDRKVPTLYKERIVAITDGAVYVQRPGEGDPFGQDFDGWLQTQNGIEIWRADIAANGKAVALELDNPDGTDDTIEVYSIDKVPDFMGDPWTANPGGCVLPAQGAADHVSLSQDGKTIAWEDDRGVVAAGIPDFSGADPCHLTRAPVVLAAGGKYPSIGAAQLPTGGDGGGGGGGGQAPVPTVPAKIKAASLKSGVWITVKVAKAGAVAVTGKVGAKVVAKGSARAKRAGRVKVRLKAVGAYRSRPQKLKGKTLVIRVTSGGKSKTVRRVLR